METGPDDCVHLTVTQDIEIHAVVLEGFGGMDGIADRGLLESAVAAPQATVFGQSPYADLIEVAAAYLFYICRNHPFRDGNKRAAMTAAIVFLRLNGIDPRPDSPVWESLVLDVAASRLDRNQTTQRLRKLIPKGRP
jgi:death-on-curing protein